MYIKVIDSYRHNIGLDKDKTKVQLVIEGEFLGKFVSKT
jgi:hypothetical protein